MDAMTAKITEFVASLDGATTGMLGIFAALVALALVSLLFSRIGK
jgi:Flp pilus assembly pilin Flp